MRKLLYALTIIGLLAYGVAAQQSGGAFIPSFNYDISGAWNFSGTIPTLTGNGSIVGTSATQTLTNKTLTSPIVSHDLIDATAATLTVTAASHGGKCIGLNRAAGVTVTLPAATGSGNRYCFFVVTAATSNQHRIVVVGNDAFFGGLFGGNDTDNNTVMWPTAADADQINWNGTTTGGFKGARLYLEDIATDVWSVIGWSDASGAEVTPFATGQVS